MFNIFCSYRKLTGFYWDFSLKDKPKALYLGKLKELMDGFQNVPEKGFHILFSSPETIIPSPLYLLKILNDTQADSIY